MTSKLLSLLFLLSFSSRIYAQIELDLTIVPRTIGTLCEPMRLSIAWQNIGSTEIKIGQERNPIRSSAVRIIVNGQEVERMPTRWQDIIDYSPMAPDTLKPGERIEGEYSIWNLELTEGDFDLKVVADFSDFPDGYYKSRIESKSLRVRLNTPREQDQRVWQFATGDTTSLSGEQIHYACRVIDSKKFYIMDAYPDSIYAAWAAFHYLDFPRDWSAAKVKHAIDMKQWPPKSEVPSLNRPDGKKILEGYELAQWQNQWIQRILASHPDFPYADRLRLVVAVNELLYGEKQSALEMLNEVSTSKSKEEAAWTKQLLQLLRQDNRS